MNHIPYNSMAPPPPWNPMLPPNPPVSRAFWETSNVREHLKKLQETLHLAKAMRKELEMLNMLKNAEEHKEVAEESVTETSVSGLSKFLEDNINLATQELFSVEAANSLVSVLRVQLEPFRVATVEGSPWEEKSAAVRLANKLLKTKRNKRWRKRKRKRLAEMRVKERERFDKADQEADEWRAREIAKDIAKRKVEKMKDIAKLKAKEEKKKLESELELVLMVEKLQELRSIRIEKLKNKGHFLPEEDDKFLERVQAAVEEEERLIIASAATDAAKNAIATAEESRKVILVAAPDSQVVNNDKDGIKESRDLTAETQDIKDPSAITDKGFIPQGSEGQDRDEGYDSVANLPMEFYHYYHGSNTDIGTLIEVRRTWDAYMRPGGSRIPGHWVQPPPPSDAVWASYLLKPK